MPVNPSDSASEMIRKEHHGKTYARTKRKYGKERAHKQAIAIGLSEKRRATRGKSGRKNKRHHRRSSR